MVLRFRAVDTFFFRRRVFTRMQHLHRIWAPPPHSPTNRRPIAVFILHKPPPPRRVVVMRCCRNKRNMGDRAQPVTREIISISNSIQIRRYLTATKRSNRSKEEKKKNFLLPKTEKFLSDTPCAHSLSAFNSVRSLHIFITLHDSHSHLLYQITARHSLATAPSRHHTRSSPVYGCAFSQIAPPLSPRIISKVRALCMRCDRPPTNITLCALEYICYLLSAIKIIGFDMMSARAHLRLLRQPYSLHQCSRGVALSRLMAVIRGRQNRNIYAYCRIC